MIRGQLTDEVNKELEEELTRFELMHDYLSKTGQQNEKFTSIRQAESLTLADGSVSIKNILLMENSKGKTEILNSSSTRYSKTQIDELAKKTGLKREDIIELMKDGMRPEDISVAAEALPFKEIAESSAIREMIRKEIKPEQLSEMSKKGIQIVPMQDGSLQVNNLQKLAEVDERGLVKLEPKLLESLKPFEQVGLIKLSSDLVVKEIEPQSLQKTRGNALKVISLEEKQAEMTKDEIEKQKIAQGLNIDSNEIVSVIRIDDKENGSKLLNDTRRMDDSTIYIIRTRNGITGNKFITAEGTKNGGYKQIQGFESTPVSKQVASLLKDTQNSIGSVSIKPGEIRAGKMHSMQNKYNYFLIRRAGESKDDDSNNLLFVGTTGNTDMSLIENRADGEKTFVQLPVSSVHPSSIYLENNRGYSQKTELSSIEEDKDMPQPEITFDDINQKKNLLKRLKEIESLIAEFEDRNRDGDELQNDELLPQNKPRNIDELYTERAQVLDQLGMDESKVVRELEEEYVIGPQGPIPH